MSLKKPKEKTGNNASKVFARLLSISHFITDFLLSCFCSSFHAFTFNTKVLYQYNLQFDRDNTNCHAHPLRFTVNWVLNYHITHADAPNWLTWYFSIRLQSLKCSSAFTPVCYVIMHGTPSKWITSFFKKKKYISPLEPFTLSSCCCNVVALAYSSTDVQYHAL